VNVTDDDFEPPSSRRGVSLSQGVSYGLVALLIGCSLLISSRVLMVFNITLFRGGLVGIPRDLAQLGGVVAVVGVAAFGILAIVFGVRGWNAASRTGESTAFGVAGTLAAVIGFVGWVIAGLDLLMILRVFR
jgi:hypothetical protein